MRTASSALRDAVLGPRSVTRILALDLWRDEVEAAANRKVADVHETVRTGL